MKRNFALTGLLLAVCAAASAQVTIPARGGARRLVDVSIPNGSITVRTHAAGDVTVESGSLSRREERAPSGMHRIDIPFRGMDVEEQGDTIVVRGRGPGGGDSAVITVPVNTSLHLRSNNGSIRVDGVHGEIDAETHNGSLSLLNVAGSVLANTHNSKILVTMDGVDSTKPSAFSTLNGSIDVTLPADQKATLKMITDNGSIYSDFDVAVSGGRALTQPNNTPDGRYRVRFDNTVTGTINGGGANMTLRTANGSIVIRKKK